MNKSIIHISNGRCVILELDQLYRVKKTDFVVLERLLTACFENDPLYTLLIPDEEVRKKLLPELFKCDLDEFFSTCKVYADSEEMNGILIVSDTTESFHIFRYLISSYYAIFKTDCYLVKEDPSLKLLWHFLRGKDYLNSKWTEHIKQKERLHVIYLAVHPSKQHCGISKALLKKVLDYADRHRLLVSLETHNEKNVTFYQHFGFEIFEIVEKSIGLKQYCMVRKRR